MRVYRLQSGLVGVFLSFCAVAFNWYSCATLQRHFYSEKTTETLSHAASSQKKMRNNDWSATLWLLWRQPSHSGRQPLYHCCWMTPIVPYLKPCYAAGSLCSTELSNRVWVLSKQKISPRWLPRSRSRMVSALILACAVCWLLCSSTQAFCNHCIFLFYSTRDLLASSLELVRLPRKKKMLSATHLSVHLFHDNVPIDKDCSPPSQCRSPNVEFLFTAVHDEFISLTRVSSMKRCSCASDNTNTSVLLDYQ